MIYIKNNTGTNQTWVEQEFAPGEYKLIFNIANSDWDSVADLNSAVLSGDAIASMAADSSGHYTDLDLALEHIEYTRRVQILGYTGN